MLVRGGRASGKLRSAEASPAGGTNDNDICTYLYLVKVSTPYVPTCLLLTRLGRRSSKVLSSGNAGCVTCSLEFSVLAT